MREKNYEQLNTTEEMDEEFLVDAVQDFVNVIQKDVLDKA